MNRILLLAALLCLAVPAAAANDIPNKGTAGIGTYFSVAPAGSPVGAPLANGLNLSYWAADQLKLTALLGLSSVENAGTAFQLGAAADFYLLKNQAEDFGIFVGGIMALQLYSPSGGNSSTAFVAQVKGGGEYWFSHHFSISIAEGLQLATKPTQFELVTTLGLNLYF